MDVYLVREYFYIRQCARTVTHHIHVFVILYCEHACVLIICFMKNDILFMPLVNDKLSILLSDKLLSLVLVLMDFWAE